MTNNMGGRFLLSIAISALCAAIPLAAQENKGECPLQKWPPDISGYIRSDASYTSATLDGMGANDDFNSLLELDFAHSIEWGDWTGSARADVDLRGDGSDQVAFLEQGYVMLTSNKCPSCFCAKLGSFNAPIGWENQDAPDKFQITNSWVFNLGTPNNLTGLDLSVRPKWQGGSFGVEAFAVNGWDVQNDNNHDRSYGGRFDLGVGDEYALAAVGLWGPEKAGNTHEARSLFDLNMTIKPCWWLTWGIDGIYGTEEGEAQLAGTDGFDGTSVWHGAQTTFHAIFMEAHELSGLVNKELLGGTLRFSMLRDQDALLTGKRRTLHDVTTAVITQPTPNLFLRGEVRFDFTSLDNGFAGYDGETSHYAMRLGVEAFYTF